MAIAQTTVGLRAKVSPATKGAVSEHYATAWLLARGYGVFRNVSADGRADLLAIDWATDETIRVDVKSSGFDLCGDAPRNKQARERAELNKGFNIRYLVVSDDGACKWYEDRTLPAAANDNVEPVATWWRCKFTGQRFPTPSNSELSNPEWSYFCQWLLKNHEDLISPFSETFIRDMSVRGRLGCVRHTAEREITVLKKLLSHVFDKLSSREAIDLGYGVS